MSVMYTIFLAFLVVHCLCLSVKQNKEMSIHIVYLICEASLKEPDHVTLDTLFKSSDLKYYLSEDTKVDLTLPEGAVAVFEVTKQKNKDNYTVLFNNDLKMYVTVRIIKSITGTYTIEDVRNSLGVENEPRVNA